MQLVQTTYGHVALEAPTLSIYISQHKNITMETSHVNIIIGRRF